MREQAKAALGGASIVEASLRETDTTMPHVHRSRRERRALASLERRYVKAVRKEITAQLAKRDNPDVVARAFGGDVLSET